MALDAGPFIRTGTRGSPSWPGSNPETGYVDADCSDQSAEAACRRGGPYVDVALLGIRVALLRGGDDGGVDDLASHRQEACPNQGCLVSPEQHLDRGPAPQGGTRQRLAERPDRVRVRHRIGQPEPEKAHERKPVLDQKLGP